MNKYCFELYEFSNRGRVFIGYKTVAALTKEDALNIVSEKLNQGVQAFPIYLEQN